jgi:hypothetical protein
VPAHSLMRVLDRDLIRAGHYGQRSCTYRPTHGCTDQRRYVGILPADAELSTRCMMLPSGADGVNTGPLSSGIADCLAKDGQGDILQGAVLRDMQQETSCRCPACGRRSSHSRAVVARLENNSYRAVERAAWRTNERTQRASE